MSNPKLWCFLLYLPQLRKIKEFNYLKFPPTLIFDEIDTGIGGKTAFKIGEMLTAISDKSQVIAITHLPQIASFADNLILVHKETKDSRTQSKITCCNSSQKDKYINEMNQLSL